MECCRYSQDFVDAVTQVIGTIDGSGKIVLKDKNQAPEDPVPVDLDLEKVLGDMPRKTYNFKRSQPQLAAHQLPQGEQIFDPLAETAGAAFGPFGWNS